ncbi:hypothetical protein HAX54_032307 [Datura stramonium]|uniref:F-box/LRR-repeat protein 15/At3g58940/PEG3-like LRR domain-containing protein n=1 Tax=Datura stramonium TaxID=4076 RepID=A0ABS8SCL0_DATST|nr:hypothetical protein [Datura stramonium]
MARGQGKKNQAKSESDDKMIEQNKPNDDIDSNNLLEEEDDETLLNTCLLIVDFILEYCSGFEKIELLNLQKINLVSIRTCRYRNQIVKIQAPTLEHLSYSGSLSQDLDVVECLNLKSLNLSYVTISDRFLQNLICRSKLLESLILLEVSLEMFNFYRSPSLKILKIQDSEGIRVIDAPNLVSLEYMGNQIPILEIATASRQLKASKIVFRCYNDNVNADWFCKLRMFLSNWISWCHVTLCFLISNEINWEDLRLSHRFANPKPKVDVLNVSFSALNWECPTFVDALLWSCRPRKLNLDSASEESESLSS